MARSKLKSGGSKNAPTKVPRSNEFPSLLPNQDVVGSGSTIYGSIGLESLITARFFPARIDM